MSQSTDSRHLLERKLTDGRGQGWFAKTDILPGTCVLSEKGVLKFSAKDFSTFFSELSNLDTQQLEDFRQLHAFASKALKKEVKEYLSVDWDDLAPDKQNDLARWSCNSWEKYGVGLLGSYFNHSCVPNTQSHRSSTGYMEYYTLESIKMGEELLVSYDNNFILQTTENRGFKIEEVWGFKCDCTACQATEEDIKVDDDNRTELFEVKKKLDSWREPVEEQVYSADMVRVAEDGVRHLRSMRLHGTYLRKWYEDLLRFNYIGAHLEEALDWADCLIEETQLCTGVGSNEDNWARQLHERVRSQM